MYENIKTFKELSGLETNTIGRKASRIAQLHNARIQVPRGFVITNAEYFNFLQKNNLKNKINTILNEINYKDPLDIKEKTEYLKHLILKSKVDDTFRSELAKAYNKVGETSVGWLNSRNDEYVAIRCSVVCEEACLMDVKKIEEEGGNLNIKGLNLLIANIKECWASLFSKNIIEYAKEKFIDINKFSMAVIVQKMIDAKQSGIMLTSKDCDNNKTCIIESVFGVGGRLVIKDLTPDHYEIKKRFFEITNKKLEKQKWMLGRQKGNTCRINLSEKESSKEKLDTLALKDLVVIARKIEDFFGTPQKTEFVINKKDIYILNSEPIDCKYNNENIKNINDNKQQKMSAFKNKLILKGVSVDKGICVGKVKIIKNNDDLDKIDEESIIVTTMTNSEMINKIKIAKGVITDLGSAICHAATICQKLAKPCIVNTKEATTKLQEDQRVQINAEKGEIYSIEGVEIISFNKTNNLNETKDKNKEFKSKIIQTINKIKNNPQTEKVNNINSVYNQITKNNNQNNRIDNDNNNINNNNTNNNSEIKIDNSKIIDIRNIENIDLNNNEKISISLDYIFSEFEINELKKLTKKEIISKIREKIEILIKNI